MSTRDKKVHQSKKRVTWIVAALLLDLLLLTIVIAAGALRGGILRVNALSDLSISAQSLPQPTPSPTINPRTPLRALAEMHGLQVGVAVAPGWLQDPEYAALLLREFNAVTPENAMKWDSIHPEPERFDFSQGDAIVEFARQNGLKVRGHTLVWFSQLPQWVLEGDYTREEWIEILRQHIHTVVGHYRGINNDHTVFAWDVVNEAVAKNGSLFDSFWLQKIGPEYILLAFQFAREADPDALLFYNDNGGEGLNPKSQGIYNLVRGLVQAGAPIDGVGMQLHTALGVAPSTNELATNIKRLTDLGLLVHFSEMDVRTQYSTDPLPIKLQNQAMIYRQTMEACLQFPGCNGFFTWGLTDRFSWIPGFTGKEDYPLLFDENYQPKPALDALLEILESK